MGWFRRLFKGKPKKKEVPEAVAWQGLLLEEDELLVYTDEDNQRHLFTKLPYDPNKEYIILYLTANEIVEVKD